MAAVDELLVRMNTPDKLKYQAMVNEYEALRKRSADFGNVCDNGGDYAWMSCQRAVELQNEADIVMNKISGFLDEMAAKYPKILTPLEVQAKAETDKRKLYLIAAIVVVVLVIALVILKKKKII